MKEQDIEEGFVLRRIARRLAYGTLLGPLVGVINNHPFKGIKESPRAYSGPWLPFIPEQSYQPFRCMVTSDSGLMVTTFSGIPEQVVTMAGTLKTVRERKEEPSDAG